MLELGEGVFEVKTTNGDTHLGGDDFDQRVITWLADEFRKEQGIDLRQDRMALQRLKDAAEKAKKELSSSMQTEINLPFITADQSGPKNLAMTLTRSRLEQLIEDLVEKSRQPVLQALNDAGEQAVESHKEYCKKNSKQQPSLQELNDVRMAGRRVDEVVLVGGQTRMPMVQNLVRRVFNKDPHKGVNPDEVVAVGAAIQAGVLTGEVRDMLLLDVTPFSLGIETLGGVFTRLVERNTTIPVDGSKHSRIFSTASDNQNSVEINVLQGEYDLAKDNHSLGRFILDGIPPAPRGKPQIEVSFDIDANGIVSVRARDKGTGREQHITIQPSGGLSAYEVERMRHEAQADAQKESRRREAVGVRNQADSEAYNAEKTLRDLGDKISSDERGEVESKIADVRSALATDDVERVHRARAALQQTLSKLTAKPSRQAASSPGRTGVPQQGPPTPHPPTWQTQPAPPQSPEPHPQAAPPQQSHPEQPAFPQASETEQPQHAREELMGAMMMEYLDFDLEIEPDAGRDYRLRAFSTEGEARAMMRFPFDELALKNHLLQLQNALLRSGGQRRRLLTNEEQAVRAFGQALFETLLSGDVRRCYDRSRAKADQTGKGLRLRLRIQAPELAALPWEYLYDQDEAEYLCLSPVTPLVRYIELSKPVQPLAITPPLRILGMIASPSTLDALDVTREQERMHAALQSLGAQVELTWLKGQTWRDLQQAMWGGPWHIFHFIGHGGFDPHTDEGVLALANDQGQAHLLPAAHLGRLLANHPSLRLVVLNACNGATGGQRDVFSSTAATVARRGIPAVLAMQEEITDRAAIELTRTFYAALAHGLPVDAAVSAAREAISVGIANSLEWGTPVLYLRASTGILFHVSKQAGAS